MMLGGCEDGGEGLLGGDDDEGGRGEGVRRRGEGHD